MVKGLRIAAVSAIFLLPVIFPHSVFPELLALRGDHGAKRLLLRQPKRTTFVDIPNAAIDIDTPDDLTNYR